MKQRIVGGTNVSVLGLGAMPMSIEGRPDRRRSIDTIHAALDEGVTLIDTADAYHLAGRDETGHNEILISEAARCFGADTAEVIIATKGGHLHPTEGPWTLNGDPGYLNRRPRNPPRVLASMRLACTSSTDRILRCRMGSRSVLLPISWMRA